ncbi:MAG TPA: hypothetical protein VH142_09070, partial [Polyangiaceae bacterium]|nr:hypothetical protein [Polyangiaceae bacterium]
MRTQRTSAFLAAAFGSAALLVASGALASNPLEYPDNGSAAFSRGGAWLALANEPIAAHYNPAALAIQGSGFSIEQQLNFDKVCYTREGPGRTPETADGAGNLIYLPACNSKASFPATIPSISIAWRASKKLGLGFAIVPPNVYGNTDGDLPPTSPGYNKLSGKFVSIPASYRFQSLNQLSTILFPTFGVGYEVLPNFRVGAAFIAGIDVFNTSVAGIQQQGAIDSTQPNGGQKDNYNNDSLSTLRTRDLFVPGAILSIHWSPLKQLDVAAWGRWISDAHTTQGTLQTTVPPYNTNGSGFNPTCQATPIGQPDKCKGGTAEVNNFSDHDANHTFKDFRFPFPPEVRVGIRFHVPRSEKTEWHENSTPTPKAGFPKVDPLHNEVFDIELDGSYALNADANTITVRFAQVDDPTSPNYGQGISKVKPAGYVPPNADKYNGYMNSFGLRLGGQYNVIQDKLGIRAGTW